MKKTLLIITTLFFSHFSNATIRQIASGSTTPSLNNYFYPQTLMAFVGDTIQWTLVSGTHTTESTTIPVGATPWNSGNITPTTFTYVVTQVGTYNYDCHHFATGGAGHGMSGTIIVSSVTSITPINDTPTVSLYPNPFSNHITLETSTINTISIYNVAGQKIKSLEVKKGEIKIELDTTEFPSGAYFMKLNSDTNVTTKQIIKE